MNREKIRRKGEMGEMENIYLFKINFKDFLLLFAFSSPFLLVFL